MAAKSPPATAKPTNGMRCGIATNTPTTRVEDELGCAMELVEMLGFAVDVFGPELPRQDGYARTCGGRRGSCGSAKYHGNTTASCKGARTLPCAPPKRSAKAPAVNTGWGRRALPGSDCKGIPAPC